MLSALSGLFTDKTFMPHGHCYFWQPAMVWLQVISNGLIGVAYVVISILLASLVYRTRDLPFKPIYAAFGTFIISCGFTHFSDILVIWHPVYWFDGTLRAITAIASVGTAVMLLPLLPRAYDLVQGARAARDRGIQLATAVRDLEVMYERSRQLETMKTQFFANVSHELRTPLTLVLGPLARLLTDPTLSTDHRRQLEMMQRNAEVLLKQVTNLLDLTKLEAGAMRPTYSQIDAAACVRRMAASFESLAHDRNIQLVVQANDPLPACLDQDKLQRIVLNLLSNAFKFTPAHGRITCCARCDADDHLVLEVRDSGPGIPESEREHIFERFAQIDGSTTRPAQGTGLGLAIVREFVLLQHGSVTVDDAPGGGARFIVRLPLTSPEAEQALTPSVASATPDHPTPAYAQELRPARHEAAPESSVPCRSAATVMVVEDNPDMRDFVRDCLADVYTIMTAENGRDALDKAIAQTPDVIVTDLMMPMMSGDQLTQALRRTPGLEDVPVLILTAKAADDDRAASLEGGAQDYVAKPFHMAELRARVANLVSMRRTRAVLQEELQTRAANIEDLVLQLRQRGRDLQSALQTARAAQQEAERLSRCRADFVNMVSHELRTPITALQLQLARLLRYREPFEQRQTKLVHEMDNSIRRLTTLIDSMLSYGRLERGCLAADMACFDVHKLIDDLVREMRPQAERHSLSVHSQADARPTITTDPLLLRVILSNLVANAIKFSPPGGHVDISTRYTDGHWEIAVADDGPGIPPEAHETIFEPFVHLEPVSQKHIPGVGLGLNLVRSLTQALGGRVEVQSSVGNGSVFRIILAA